MRLLFFCWLIAFIGLGPAIFAQTDRALLRELAEENKKSVEALVLYPQDTWLAILEATKYPQLVVKMRSMQQKTAAAFRTLIEDFPRSTQAVFYDLARYPNLISDLAVRQENPEAWPDLLQVLPESKRQEAYQVLQRQMPTLLKINELNQTTDDAFAVLLSAYPSSVQEAFRQLTQMPEVLDILNEDLRFTILVGDTYQEDPAWVLHKMDSLSLAVAREHADELTDWEKTIADDPAAASELKAAAQEYKAEYDEDDQDYPYQVSPQVVEFHQYYAYPWWYGYPWWEPYPRWRPYPYWYDWGFNPYAPSVVIVCMPSWHFMHWYFDHPRHHHRYNHLSAHFVNHYNVHRHSGTTISVGVGEWRDQNRTIISEEWLGDKGRLPQRLSEYGHFEENRARYNTRNPTRPVDKETYLEKNARQYPELQRSREAARTEIRRGDDSNERKPSDWAPAKAPTTREPAAAQPRTEKPILKEPNPKAREPQKNPLPRESAPSKPRQTDQPEEYHRQKWEETRRSEPTPKRREAQPAKQAPPKQTPAPRQRTEKPASKAPNRRN